MFLWCIMGLVLFFFIGFKGELIYPVFFGMQQY